jgi:hypothetical protein
MITAMLPVLVIISFLTMAFIQQPQEQVDEWR